MPETRGEVTRLLLAIRRGERGAEDDLFKLVYEELRAIARRQMRHERAGHTLQPTALVSEMYIRLRPGLGNVNDRVHLLKLAKIVMNRRLVEYARGKHTPSLSTGEPQVGPRPDWILDLDSALAELASANPRAREVVEYRYWGYKFAEIVELLGVSLSTVENDWRMARAWLFRRIGPER
jgi:RNA polymerase sigma factor (TIGR02999 family)